jgi:hypothetical protein
MARRTEEAVKSEGRRRRRRVGGKLLSRNQGLRETEECVLARPTSTHAIVDPALPDSHQRLKQAAKRSKTVQVIRAGVEAAFEAT